MPRREYQTALEDVEADVLEMGDCVLAQLRDALDALDGRDEELAASVLAGDEAVNRRYLDVESACIDLLALQQPVASDLRFVAGSFKVVTDLERIGDLATNLAEYAMGAERQRLPEVDASGIGTDVHDLVGDALAAYEHRDVEACYRIADRDDGIDAACQRASERIVRDLVEYEAAGDDPWSTEQLLDDVSRVLLTIRDLERVADHAVNVAGRTLYVVESDPELIY